MKVIRILILASIAFAAPVLVAAELKCAGPPTNLEEYHYTWRLRGGLGWIAGLIFPRTGFGDLRITYPKSGESVLHSRLLITSPGSKDGFYLYESEFDDDASRTLMTYHGYQWGDRSRKERTVFDYAKGLARFHKETPGKSEDTVRLLPRADDVRDILTAIHYLRENAESIKAPITTSIYSDGKEYSVSFRPTGRETFTLQGQRVGALGFEIGDAPGGKRWPGGVRVWISEDARRIPFRIDIVETLASMQLDLQSVESCGFLIAKK